MFGFYKKFRPILYRASKSLTSDDFAGRVVFGFDQTIMKILPLIGSSSSERSVEYDWVLENLPFTKGKILDIGSGASHFPSKLLYEGFEVYSLEVQKPIVQKSKIIFKQGDIRDTGFDRDFFDVVTLVSTLEHIGLGFYDDPVYPDGDFKTIKEIERILKRGGFLILTTPFSNSYLKSWQRIYDHERLEKLTEGFNLVKETFFAKKGRRWISANRKEAEGAGVWELPTQWEGKAGYGSRAIVCLVLQK